MKIEEEIFKRYCVCLDKLESFGFQKENDVYVYNKNFLDNQFKAVITISNDGKITGKVIETDLNEEYINLRINYENTFVNSVRNAYNEILVDIRNNCYIKKAFISNQSNRIAEYIYNKYSDSPEFLWAKFPGFGVFRNKKNNKWYGAIMNIDKSKIDKMNNHKEIEIINVKLSPDKVGELLMQKGFYKAYHMNNKSWITIILDDTIMDKVIEELIDESYSIIAGEK